MFLNNQRTLSAVAGGLDGFVSWLFIEPLIAPRLQFVSGFGSLLGLDAAFGAVAGICIGIALGAGGGLLARSAYQARRGGLIGAIAGVIGGATGLVIGEVVYQPLQCIPFGGRGIGWAVFGAFLGGAQGITRGSRAGLRSAALGGVVGGAVGGFAFDLVGLFTVLIFGSDALSRGVALTVLGACIGLWIVIVEQRLAPAILKIVSGRLEGREFVLDKPQLTVGSDERGDVGIFADPQVRHHHATLHHEGGAYVIRAEAGAPLQVNRQPVSEQALQHDDELTVGQTRLIYRQKDAIASARTPAARPHPAPAASPVTGILWLVDRRTGRRYPLRSPATAIGRAPDNDIVLDDPTISGHHAVVQFENGRYVLYDRDSSNGTFVNGQRIVGPHMLRAGWTVQMGDVHLIVANN